MLLKSKIAIERAKGYFKEVFPDVKDLRLEEIERSLDCKNWLVTFSFARPDLLLFGETVTNPHRDYKTVTVGGSTGELRAIRIKVLSP